MISHYTQGYSAISRYITSYDLMSYLHIISRLFKPVQGKYFTMQGHIFGGKFSTSPSSIGLLHASNLEFKVLEMANDIVNRKPPQFVGASRLRISHIFPVYHIITICPSCSCVSKVLCLFYMFLHPQCIHSYLYIYIYI